MATVRLTTLPQGSQLTSTIQKGAVPPEPDSKNDFRVRMAWDENVTQLKTNSITAMNATIVDIDGENAAYDVTVRPPESATTITFVVAADAVAEGNPEATLTIRVSTGFPDTDAESPTQVFDHNKTNVRGIAVTPTRILVAHGTSTGVLSKFTHAGTEQTGEEITNTSISGGKIDVINGDFLRLGGRYDLSSFDVILANYGFPTISGITHSRLGITGIASVTTTTPNIFRDTIYTRPYAATDSSDIVTHSLPTFNNNTNTAITHQSDSIYVLNASRISSYQITDADEIAFLQPLNIDAEGGGADFQDIAIYRDAFYFTNNNGVYTLDIRKYRPMAENTKTSIYPVFATNGDRIPLEQYAPDAETFVWEVGYDLPSYLSIDATSNELVIASNAVSVETPVLVKLTGINQIDATARNAFGFYLIIQPAVAPVWRDVDDLTMRANATFDMHQIVDADSISLQSGPTGSSISNGVFTIATTGGDARFRATKGSLTSDTTINITVVQASDPANFSDNFKYRTEIAGIDVSEDVLIQPQVSVSLDAIELNEYIPNEIDLTLKSDDQNGYKFTDGIANNFWESNNLNPTGFREPIQIFIDSEVGGSTISHLLFSGIILRMHAPIGAAAAELECVDISELLRETLVQDFGTLTKWDALRQRSDEVTYQGLYVPEGSLTPIQFDTGQAWEDRTALTMRRLALPSEGPPLTNEAYLTPTQLQTSGGLLDDAPILRFKTQHRSEDIRFLVAQLGLNKVIYNTEVDLPTVETDDAYVLNRGSVSTSVEATRNTLLLTDWVHDTTNDRVLMLLHNPEGHIADQIVQYNTSTDSYRTLYTFAKNIKAHRIERRTSTDYYILTSGAISQDRSAATLPRTTDNTGYAYDSAADGSVIRVYRYNAATNTLTEHVAEDDTYPPQLGVHYHVGFENPLYIDEFEGILPHDRGAFRWYSGHLYYRYAKDGEFGVARVNTSGTTEQILDNSANLEMDAFFVARNTSNPLISIVPAEVGHGQTPTGDFLQTFNIQANTVFGMTIDASGNIYTPTSSPRGQIHVNPSNTADGTTAVELRSFNLPSGVRPPFGTVVQGNDLFTIRERTVTVIPANTPDGQTASITRQFTVDIAELSDATGLAIRGSELFIANGNRNNVHVVNANTPHNGSATSQRHFDLPTPDSGNVQAITMYGDILAYTNPQKVILVDADTPNGAEAPIIREINIPSAGTDSQNLTALALGERAFTFADVRSFKQSLSFAFDVTSTGTVYFAQCVETLGFSALIIKQQTAGGTESVVFSDARAVSDLTDLDDTGGAYQGVQECLFHNNFLYLLVEIGRVDVDGDTVRPSRRKAAGMVLYRCNITASDPSLTVLDKWDFATRGGCNLTVHAGEVHYCESSPALAMFKPYNPDL